MSYARSLRPELSITVGTSTSLNSFTSGTRSAASWAHLRSSPGTWRSARLRAGRRSRENRSFGAAGRAGRPPRRPRSAAPRLPTPGPAPRRGHPPSRQGRGRRPGGGQSRCPCARARPRRGRRSRCRRGGRCPPATIRWPRGGAEGWRQAWPERARLFHCGRTPSALRRIVPKGKGTIQTLPRPLYLLPRPHDLDQLLPALGWPDHDRAHQPVVQEEQLPEESLLERIGSYRLEVRLHVRRHTHDGQRRAEHRRRVRRHVEELLLFARHVVGRRLAMRLGVVPGPHLVVLAHHLVEEDRHVTGGIYVRRRRPQPGVGHDPPSELDAHVARGLRVVVEADPVAQHVELDVVAADRLSLEAPVASREARDLVLTDE